MRANDWELFDIIEELLWIGRFCRGLFHDDLQPDCWRNKIIDKLTELHCQLGEFLDKEKQGNVQQV